jgi:hypothetical protein
LTARIGRIQPAKYRDPLNRAPEAIGLDGLVSGRGGATHRFEKRRELACIRRGWFDCGRWRRGADYPAHRVCRSRCWQDKRLGGRLGVGLGLARACGLGSRRRLRRRGLRRERSGKRRRTLRRNRAGVRGLRSGGGERTRIHAWIRWGGFHLRRLPGKMRIGLLPVSVTGAPRKQERQSTRQRQPAPKLFAHPLTLFGSPCTRKAKVDEGAKVSKSSSYGTKRGCLASSRYKLPYPFERAARKYSSPVRVVRARFGLLARSLPNHFPDFLVEST